jgi:hypothetical protein
MSLNDLFFKICCSACDNDEEEENEDGAGDDDDDDDEDDDDAVSYAKDAKGLFDILPDYIIIQL